MDKGSRDRIEIPRNRMIESLGICVRASRVKSGILGITSSQKGFGGACWGSLRTPRSDPQSFQEGIDRPCRDSKNSDTMESKDP